MFRVLIIGDIMGKPGRQCVARLLPIAREKFSPDVVLVNGENAAGGFGLTQKIYHQLIENMGIDGITMGNHWADKREIYEFLPKTTNLIIPANMMNVEDESQGYRLLESKTGQRFAVINVIGKAFMHPENRNAFHALERIFQRLPESVKVRIVDVHAEATSEKQAIGRYLAGRASLVYGTHSHVPTADERIFEEGTGFATDVGMTGAYDSVIGICKEASISRFVTGEAKKFEPATGDPWMCFLVADINPATGRCEKIARERWEARHYL